MKLSDFIRKPSDPLDELAEQLERCRNGKAEFEIKVEAKQALYDHTGSAAAQRNFAAACEDLQSAQRAEARAERLYNAAVEREEDKQREAQRAEAAKLESEITLLAREDETLAKREAQEMIQAIETRDERRTARREALSLRMKLDNIRRELGQEVIRSISDSNTEPTNTPIYNAIENYISDLDGDDPRRNDARKLVPANRNILAGGGHSFTPARS